MDKVGRYLEMAEPFHCDFSHHLFMGHLGNHMLNAADFHSRDRGFGMDFLNSIKKTWVLSRLAIEMDEMPCQYDKFYVETWVESAMRYFTQRNFRVVSEDGAENPMSKLTRVQMDDKTELVRTIDTFYNDVDINGHINSVKYIEHVLDLFPIDWYKEHPLKRFDIAYVAEAHQGDRLNFYQEQDADDALAFKIRITKSTAEGGEEVETCRSKVKFV